MRSTPKNKTYFAYTEPEKADYHEAGIDGQKFTIQRSKGLGENDPRNDVTDHHEAPKAAA